MELLLAIDDSKFSEAAKQAVLSRFRPQETEVLVLNVVQPLSSAPAPHITSGYAPELAEAIKRSKDLVEKTARELRDKGFQADAASKTGEVRGTIVDTAAEWRAELIVVGSHSRRGLERLLLGSVAEFVVRHAPCSVLVVRPVAAH